eukprot:3805029-Prymnesium_polylepis.1
MMFQTRVHTFALANSGPVELSYSLAVRNSDGGPEPLPPKDAPFSVSPRSGKIAPGSTASVTISFAPTEVDTFARLLEVSCPNLAPGTSPPSITLAARSERPYCHMEMQQSDYLRAGRRSPDMPGPDGSLGPLDPSTKVIEFESLGTKVRNTRRFMVVNPTNR